MANTHSLLYKISFSHRVWHDAREIRQDRLGNDMKPPQEEIFEIRSAYIRDELGFVINPFLIYFEEGENELTIVSRREPMSIIEIEITSYEKLKHIKKLKKNTNKMDTKKLMAALDMWLKEKKRHKRSSPTLYPTNDRTSAYNSPAHPVKIKYNSIGGSKWTVPGDWISWEVEVPEDGLYQISFRSKQNVNRGMFSSPSCLYRWRDSVC